MKNDSQRKDWSVKSDLASKTPRTAKKYEDMCRNGGGIVSVSGGVFITGTLFVRFYVGFRIDANATPEDIYLIIVSLR